MFLPAVLLFLLPAIVSARDTTACAAACQGAIADLQFEGSPPTATYYTLACTNALQVQSTFLCMRYYCSDTEIADGLAYIAGLCETYGAVRPLPWSIISNITDEQALACPHVEEADLQIPGKYDTPVFLSDVLFKTSLKTEVDSALRYGT